MKRNGFILIAVTLAWLAAVNWAVNWVDGLDYSDLPNEQKLAAARFLWQYSPALDVETDAKRAVKFSWITATTRINKKEKKELQKILAMLEFEFKFLTNYLAHHPTINQSTKNQFSVHLLTYLNRVELYQKYTDLKVERMFSEIDAAFAVEPDPSKKENWYREMMIRAHLKGDGHAYQSYKVKLTVLLKREMVNISTEYIDGIMNFYEGVLSCIGKQTERAIVPLNKAIEKMALYPKFTTNFFYGDLNVLLVARGKQESAVCNNLLTKTVLSGA